MKKHQFKNYDLVVNQDKTKELIFDVYKVIEYKPTSKKIKELGAYFYLVNEKKDYKNRRISAVYTKGHDLKEFYFDTVTSYYKATRTDKLIIEEISRQEYIEITAELKEKIKGVAKVG